MAASLSRQSWHGAKVKDPCAVKKELLLSQSGAEIIHAELVSNLNRDGELSDQERNHLNAAVEHWRVRLEKERLALVDHIKQHGCVDSD